VYERSVWRTESKFEVRARKLGHAISWGCKICQYTLREAQTTRAGRWVPCFYDAVTGVGSRERNFPTMSAVRR
jgi:hypothetical protein